MKHNHFKQLRPKKTFFMTKEGLDNLKKRLDELTTRRLKTVMELRLGDIADKDELDLATQLQEIEKSELEVAKLNALLQRVEPVVKGELPESVSVGCRVALKCGNDTSAYTVVCPLEVDIMNSKISEDSLLGRAMLGKKVNDTFSITTPKGAVNSYTIIAIQ